MQSNSSNFSISVRQKESRHEDHRTVKINVRSRNISSIFDGTSSWLLRINEVAVRARIKIEEAVCPLPTKFFDEIQFPENQLSQLRYAVGRTNEESTIRSKAFFSGNAAFFVFVASKNLPRISARLPEPPWPESSKTDKILKFQI